MTVPGARAQAGVNGLCGAAGKACLLTPTPTTTTPGLWSLVKRAPKSKVKRKTFEVAGPAVAGALPLDARAKQIFAHFKKYNYEVASTGDVIKFVGNYRAEPSQAAALGLYTLVGLASTALVLSITFPALGNWWYALCLVSPASSAYYMAKADRTEEVRVKMVTSDDDAVTDIVVEGASGKVCGRGGGARAGPPLPTSVLPPPQLPPHSHHLYCQATRRRLSAFGRSWG